MAHPQLRGIEPPGMIHLPRLGLTPITSIIGFVSCGSSYCQVQLKDKINPELITEGLMYFQRKLPTFQRISRYRLINPDLL